MKRTILVVTELYPNVTNSFIGSFVVQQLELLKRHFTIVVITVHRIRLLKRRGKITLRQPYYRQEQGFHVYSIPHMPFWLEWPGYLLNRISRRFTAFQFAVDKLLTTRRILALARELHAHYHFSIVHGHETYIGDEAASVGHQLNIPSVFTLHGLYPYHLQGWGESVMRRAVANMNATDRLIAVSRLAAQSYMDQGVQRGFEIIPNGVRPPEREGRFHLPKEVMAFTRGKLVLLTVGFFVPEKRIGYSIRTLGRLRADGIRNVVLLLIGKGFLEPKLRKMIQEEKLTDAVRIVGEVPPKEMAGYYSITDVLVHPSVVESFSMVCLEAMSYGKPIVCTSAIGLTEFLKSGKNAIVVPPDDFNDLYRAVFKLVQNAPLRRTIGRQAQRVAQHLSWSRQVRKLRRIYEDAGSKQEGTRRF